MKLSFSVRGWGRLTWDDMVTMADDLGFQGIEVYNINKHEELTGKGGVFHKYNTAATARELHNKKLTIPCMDSSCDITAEGNEEIEKLMALLETAKNLGVPYISVRARKDTMERCIEVLEQLLPIAKESGVKILVKTCDIFADTKKLRDLMNHFACDDLAALWSVHHPYREKGENPDETITNLGAYVEHVHLRDSDDNGEFRIIGEGTLPVEEIMDALTSVNYNGYVSIEWKRSWMPEIDDAEVIFAHFITYMDRFNKQNRKKRVLYPNHDGTGEYVWPHGDLINETFPQVLDRMVEEFPDQYAFRYTTLDYTRTYSEFRDDVDNFARALLSMGVTEGTKVAIWATNVPAWFITFWATTKIGAVLVTVNTAYKIHEAEYLLRQSDTHTLVMIESAVDSDYAGIINELCPELKDTVPGEPLHSKKLPFLRNVVTVGFKQPGCLTFDQVMERANMVPLEEVYRRAANIKGDDVCNMQYTSGTTGFPKGVMLTHYNVVNNGKSIGDRMGLSTADRMMIQVPMFHCFGMVLAMTASMTHGTTLSPIPYFSAKSSLACINQEKITCFHGVPTMFIAMFNHPDYRKTDFSHMRTGIMAGAGCPPELMRRAADPNEMHMIGITSVYGQTESSPGSTQTTWTDPLDMRCDTVGYAFPHVECKVIDPETGEEVPNGVNGEFCSRGYNQMKGYYKMPRATRETIDNDGWLHSGDLACKNDDGTYRITGRLKDMIIRGGENIYPKEIEEFIYTHDNVSDVQVIGVPDKKYGEEICACIILKEGRTMTTEEMHDYIMSHMARHKVPKYILFVDSFPMNAAGKIQKFKMREHYAKELGLDNI